MKNAFDFLKQIKENNNREWFAANKLLYDAIAKDNKVFFSEIESELKKNDSIEKVNIYRIYRDIRFKKDKTPYKTNFGASFSRTKPFLRGGYYIHLEPNNTFVGGGFWSPNPEDLLRIRKEFEMSTQEIDSIITSPEFIKYFGTLEGEGVKTSPKGFDKNHPAIDLLRKKQFIAFRSFTDQEVFDVSFKTETVKTFLALRPFFDYMSEVLTTDLNGESLY